MSTNDRIELSLEAALANSISAPCPAKLAAALHHAVFPGGARVRPRLCLAVALACGDKHPELADAAAASIELLHCASLVHDDLPCFDNADLRRGQPSVHKAFGSPLAVLAGDALIISAFQVLTQHVERAPIQTASLLSIVCSSVGGPKGVIAGQAWECEDQIPLNDYHRAKTGSLFAAATLAGAQASGQAPEPWRLLGERLGEAYQIADDICDIVSDARERGKPCVKFLRVRLELYIVVFAEYALVARDDVGSRVHFSGRNCPRKFPGKASREADNAFGMPREECIVNARLVVEPLKIRDGNELDEVLPSGVVLREKGDVETGLINPGAFVLESVRCKVGLDAEYWLDAGLSRLLIELDGAVKVPVIGKRQRIHAKLFCSRNQVVNLCEAVE